MHDYDPALRTRTLARIVGPYLIAMAVALCVRRDTIPEFFASFMQDDALTFVAGAFTLIVGLGIVAAHHHWSGFSAASISLIGIGGSFKGAALMIAPGLGSEMTDAVVAAPIALQIIVCLQLLLGLWLSFVGWVREHLKFALALDR
ncbi:MAG: hypothetical protein JNL81_05790 [Hyphomonadaceae bacterium]|nr:hypothetical protein [Hyphomonadaceae bacterium]